MKLKIVQLIHLAFCTAILVFAGVVLFINKETLKLGLSFESTDQTLLIAPLMAIFMLIIAPIISNKLLGGLDENDDIFSKLNRYQTAFLVRAAFYESAAFFNIVCCLITSNVLFMIFAGLTFFALWWSKPTLAKVSQTLGIPESDLA